jgi:DMSO/TMAO reductase YedYZ molybdopterin-dependent catalytic subunit
MNGLVFVVGLVIRTDLRDALKMFLYYTGLPLAKLLRRTWLQPRFNTKYNALQRVAYFSVALAGILAVLTGWAIHKPMQLYWLSWIFGGYDKARIWHFWLMCFFILFVAPHVILVLADGWDTLRSMIVGWSTRAAGGTKGRIGGLLTMNRENEHCAAETNNTSSTDNTPSTETVSRRRPASFFEERPPRVTEVAPQLLRRWTRRDLLLFGAGALAAVAAGGALLPQTTLARLGIIHEHENWPKKEWLLNKSLRIDDDVAEALYSKDRLVPTYTKSQITPLRNNYNGATPDPSYIPEWRLTLDGLASGLSVSLNIRNLLGSFQVHDQITRLVCVEGWSAIAGWAGIRFDDVLRAYPPMSQAKWVRLESSVNLGPWGNPDPYFVSLDLSTARHPQTLLATHLNGKPLTVEHGAPLRLLVPVKLGLKNMKAITRISYTENEPADYWAKRGYSRYDGI